MIYRFDPARGLIILRAEISGPSGRAAIRLALDTGATATLVNTDILIALGYDPESSKDRLQITTGSGIEHASRVTLPSIRTLGVTRRRLSVLSHTLPPTAGVDGLLGLDFFRGRKLSINFENGQLRLD